MTDRCSTEPVRFRMGLLLHDSAPPPPPLDEDSLERLERALGPRPGRRWPWALGSSLAGALAACALVLSLGRPSPVAPPRTPPYQAGPSLAVEEPPVGRTFTADQGQPGTVHFVDGSLVTLAPGARATVAAEEASRALVTVVSGRVHFRVRHRSETRWQVNAGPFRVHVTGTAFAVSWSAARTVFELALDEGSVLVEGASAGAGLPLIAGQTLVAHVDTGEIRVGSARAAVPVAPTSPPVAPALAAPSAAPTPSVVAPAAPPPAGPSAALTPPPMPRAPVDPTAGWAALLEQGDYARLLEEAERLGIERCLDVCSPAAKMALADAARYRGRADLAQRTLHALADQDGHSPQVARALFLLGQRAESDGATAAALAFYQRCQQSERPGIYGTLALGRAMALHRASGDQRAAREDARLYLQRSPQGPQADEARALIGPNP